MKKLYAIIWATVLLLRVTSTRKLTPAVVVSAGGFSNSFNGSLLFTVGETSKLQSFFSANNLFTRILCTIKYSYRNSSGDLVPVISKINLFK